MLPTTKVAEPAMKNHLRPKRSDKRPPTVTKIAPPRFHEMVIQVKLGEGPRSALIKLKTAGGIRSVKT